MLTPATPQNRLERIAAARRAVLDDGLAPAQAMAPWVERSWRRCLAAGLSVRAPVEFACVPASEQRLTQEANQRLLQAAQTVLGNLARAIVNTRYFAILTNAHGMVVDAQGAIDHSDPRAHLITRVGTDLSEMRLGTTAIGTALAELQPVWLHRGEHFFEATSVYSCAGAPLLGPDGRCVGMLDVTGVDTQERPELKHLVAQSARKIENALLLNAPHHLLLRLNWPGDSLGSDADGLLALDADGWVVGANPVARQLVPGLGAEAVTGAQASGTAPQPPAVAPGQRPHASLDAPVHVSALFGLAFEQIFDAAHGQAPFELPLWSGLRLQAMSQPCGQAGRPTRLALRDVQLVLIRNALEAARGNVAQAAQALGISRATLYRRLHQRPGP
ncbi:MAG: hypothetical protein Fur007_13010 [Rhodoferax sp.]